ncbi:MAG: zinc-finger domain-containing protein [Bdellovibrionales bacterium]
MPQPSATLPETIAVITDKIACAGNDGTLGHPRVYLTMDKSGRIDCPYCGRRYIKAISAK